MNRVICPRCWKHKDPYCDECENVGSVQDVKLSQNFHLSEFLYSPTAQVKRIQNDATIRQQDRVQELVVNLLQPMRNALGRIAVTSGLRSPELNRAVKGSNDSAHLFGYAGDVQPEEVSLYEAMYFLMRSGSKFDQIILEHGSREDLVNDDWLHVGWKRSSDVQRQQMLVMRNGVYTPMVAVIVLSIVLLFFFWVIPVFIQFVSWCAVAALVLSLVVGALGLLRSPR